MKCEFFKENIFEYIDGELEKEKAEDFEKHLEECEECRKEYESSKAMLECLHKAEYVPSAKIYDSVMSEIKKPKTKLRFSQWTKYASCAAGFIILIGAVYGISTGLISEHKSMDADMAEEYENISSVDGYGIVEKSDDESDEIIAYLNNRTEAAATEKIGNASLKFETERDADKIISETDEASNESEKSGNSEKYKEDENSGEDDTIALHFYSAAYSDETMPEGIDTCGEDAENIETYKKLGEACIQYAKIDYDTVDIYHNFDEKEWVVILYRNTVFSEAVNSEVSEHTVQKLIFDENLNLTDEFFKNVN